jgi:TATA-box binding protein (TBP) (component of TFIID and TFIIIB)
MNINEEWENFISTDLNYDDDDYYDIENDSKCENEYIFPNLKNQLINNNYEVKCSDIYISTKTKIAYLNIPINLHKLFWLTPIIPYMEPKNGVIKKQMKFNSSTQEELNDIKERLKNIGYYDEQVITSIDNPHGRIKFKDIRKITIGLSKKDIMSYRSKKKSAFYNCFVLILRIKINSIFKEFHVKVFNTGKMEIPGIQNDESFNKILDLVIEILQPNIDEKLEYRDANCETVLINSNFNCGFYINRDALYDLLKYKYNIQSIYDSCTYPGVQCKFYFNPNLSIEEQTGSQISKENMEKHKNIKEVSFMIFRTGSVLIVGKCDEYILMIIYEFLKKILKTEYNNICQQNIHNENIVENKNKIKNKKVRRKHIIISCNENDKNDTM